MKDIWKEYESCMEQAAAECREKEERLIGEERKDEANLCRIQENIYGIFKTFAEVSSTQGAADREGFVEERAGRVIGTWQKSYEKAKDYGDTEKMLIEETKLVAAKYAFSKLPKGDKQ